MNAVKLMNQIQLDPLTTSIATCETTTSVFLTTSENHSVKRRASWIASGMSTTVCISLYIVYLCMQYAIYTASRLTRSSGSLKYGQPRYTSHLVWHELLARCLLQKTRPELWPLAIPCTG